MEKNQIRLHKIPLGPFLDALLELYNEGLDYVDLVGTPDEEQDTIGIMFTKDYMSKDMRDRYKELGRMLSEIDDEDITDESISKNIDLSNDDDLNQII